MPRNRRKNRGGKANAPSPQSQSPKQQQQQQSQQQQKQQQQQQQSDSAPREPFHWKLRTPTADDAARARALAAKAAPFVDAAYAEQIELHLTHAVAQVTPRAAHASRLAAVRLILTF